MDNNVLFKLFLKIYTKIQFYNNSALKRTKTAEHKRLCCHPATLGHQQPWRGTSDTFALDQTTMKYSLHRKYAEKI